MPEYLLRSADRLAHFAGEQLPQTGEQPANRSSAIRT